MKPYIAKSDVQIAHITLKVADLDTMTSFYKNTVGLEVIQKNLEEHFLGVGKKVLLILKKVHTPLARGNQVGLFHMAFLLLERKDLGEALRSYLKINLLTGASDHGYSEALYFNDPEGNGIEIYWDKPKSQWDIRDNGEIVGITERLALENVLEESSGSFTGFPANTKIGHVHLKVNDLKETENFYVKELGLRLKYNYGTQAKFFAAGSYHHHIGANTWAGNNLPQPKENDLGLEEIVFSKVNLEQLENFWESLHLSFEKSSNSLKIIDPNGIKIKLID